MTITNRGGSGDGRMPFPLSLPVHARNSGCAAEAADSPLLRALVARFLDPDTSRAHVCPPAPVSPTTPPR